MICIFFLFSTFFLSTHVSASSPVNPLFQACKPHSCGKGPNISYPFLIDGVPSYCGYPVFFLSCYNQQPLLQISQNEYYIRDIFYNNQSLWLLNKNLPHQNCPPSSISNLILSRSTIYKVAPSQLSVSFFFNCTGSFPSGLQSYPIHCLSNQTHTSYTTLYDKDKEMLGLKCEASAVAPVGEMEEGVVQGYLLRNEYGELFDKGFVMQWTATNCSGCTESGGRCGFSSGQLMCLCIDRPYFGKCPHRLSKEGRQKRRWKIILGILIVAAGILGACICFFILQRRRQRLNLSHGRSALTNLVFFRKVKTSVPRKVEMFLQNYGAHTLRRFSYSDIKRMTNSFSDKLGQGGYGSVFKGKLRDGRLVAVKLLLESTKCDGEEFMNEVSSIGRTFHINIVTLLGFCSDGSRRALIYEFMPNGSLDNFIYAQETRPLGWEKLYKIAVDIARGLEYLHGGCNMRILHFDIKPHNILLDQDYCPKISDFGLAKLCPTKESAVSMLGARGTIGYIAPEVVSRSFGKVSYKSDVYSYGMMVLEMVGGRKNIDVHVENFSQIYFPKWVYKRIDQNEDLELRGIVTEEDERTARKMILVSLWCIQTNPGSRPSMSQVVDMLEGSVEVLELPPEPFLTSPTTSQRTEVSILPHLMTDCNS